MPGAKTRSQKRSERTLVRACRAASRDFQHYPVPGCESIGEEGIKRLDNLVVHMKNKLRAFSAGGSHWDWLILGVT
ncbi:hypothetical protein C7212DRAFT_321539 [Tuber magnatum]|uniref:Uncharacterized protein n=1 Tax=Tuber magnatum TaxID=42249 RepID=A0A317SRC6_9PEZI|nr:hypothetical protein C7212DRAFT_321539 [Tuber magnatum]